MSTLPPADQPKPPRGPQWLTLIVSLALCGVGCLGLLGMQLAAASGVWPGGNVVQVCVGVNTTPRRQVGLTWIRPDMSSLPPVQLQNPVCTLFPWLAVLPPRGGVAFP